MYTVCPECKQIFHIQADHLRAAAGRVRCGDCGAVFVALERAYETISDAQESAGVQVSQEIDDLVDKALGQIAVDNRTAEAEKEGRQRVTTTRAPVWADFDFFANPAGGEFAVREPVIKVVSGVEEDFLDYAESDTVAGISYRVWLSIAAIVLLAVLLFGQFVYIERSQFAGNHELRPLLERYCGWLGCELPLFRAPQALEMVEHEIRVHPKAENALLITATFVNQADFEQPWPVFRVSFSDVSGTIVAVRDFLPQEYLQVGELPWSGLLPSQPAQARLEIIDPGERAMSYQFDFY